MRTYINKVADGCYEKVESIQTKRSLLNPEGKAKTEPLAKLGDILRANMQSAVDDSIQTHGFGGLQYCGTDLICPGDPRYRDVVRGKSVGVISEAKTGAVGNSTIVFFQETPTEIKNFSTDLNAEQLMKNVAFISDKAVTAFSKYLSAGAGIPAP